MLCDFRIKLIYHINHTMNLGGNRNGDLGFGICGVNGERGAELHFMVVGFVAHQLPHREGQTKKDMLAI